MHDHWVDVVRWEPKTGHDRQQANRRQHYRHGGSPLSSVNKLRCGLRSCGDGFERLEYDTELACVVRAV
jgi:hypothetical protein